MFELYFKVVLNICLGLKFKIFVSNIFKKTHMYHIIKYLVRITLRDSSTYQSLSLFPNNHKFEFSQSYWSFTW